MEDRVWFSSGLLSLTVSLNGLIGAPVYLSVRVTVRQHLQPGSDSCEVIGKAEWVVIVQAG